ncbi:unnamed protein product, partial [Ixodes pacificus]
MYSIIQRVQGKNISLVCDKTSGCGHDERLFVVMRHFCDVKNRSVEVFLALERLTSLDSSLVFSTLQAVLTGLKVSWDSVSSVCFDGASTVSGHVSGVQAECKEQNNKIVYVHCYAHCLNLVLVDGC